MFFILKKFIGGLLLPLPFLLIIIGFSLFLLWFNRWLKTAKILLSISWLFLVLFSLQPVADKLLLQFEQYYQTYNDDNPVEYIIVLGGQYTYNSKWAPSSNLGANSLARVAEGIRQHIKQPNTKLVFTGGNAKGNPVSSAQTAAKVAISLGVNQQSIIKIENVYDTEQEAKAIHKLVNKKPFLLVTSASHMPRAINFFKQLGMSPIAVPANQLAVQTALNPWEKSIPSALYLSHSQIAFYEFFGNIWQSITD